MSRRSNRVTWWPASLAPWRNRSTKAAVFPPRLGEPLSTIIFLPIKIILFCLLWLPPAALRQKRPKPRVPKAQDRLCGFCPLRAFPGRLSCGEGLSRKPAAGAVIYIVADIGGKSRGENSLNRSQGIKSGLRPLFLIHFKVPRRWESPERTIKNSRKASWSFLRLPGFPEKLTLDNRLPGHFLGLGNVQNFQHGGSDVRQTAALPQLAGDSPPRRRAPGWWCGR